MAIPNLGSRKSYQPSGLVNWGGFIPLAILALIASALIAGLLYFLFTVGFYLVIIAPAIAALCAAGMVTLAVHKGRCRSAFVAGLLGAAAGIILYVGYFYVGMVAAIGVENAGQLGVLPTYIRLRMQTDVVRDVHSPTPEPGREEPTSGQAFKNWAFFGIEFVLVIIIPGSMGMHWARRAYCEKCQTWMNRETTTFKPEIGPAFVEALRIASAQSLAALFTSPPKLGAPNTAVAVDYCLNRKEGRSMDCPVYLSIKQVTSSSKGATTDPFKNTIGKIIVDRTLVEQTEIAALLTRFTSLEKAAGTTAAKALEDFHVEVKTKQQVLADIKPVDPLFAGKVLTTKHKLIGSALIIAPLLGCFGCFFLAIYGCMITFPARIPAGGVPAATSLFGKFLIGFGSIGGIGGFVMLLTGIDYFATRYIRRVTMREFARRPHPLVKAGDPGAHFTQVIPRANWGKVKLDDASDIGFLRVDRERGELLFEGDNECYRIRGEAIVSCDVELFISGQGSHGATKLYRVVLQVNDPSGIKEIPIAQRGNVGKYRAGKRAKWAQALQQEIRGLTGTAAIEPGMV